MSKSFTYNEVSRLQLARLCEAVGWQDGVREHLELQEALFSPWGSYDVPSQVPYASDIGDDHSPYEYSLAFGPNGLEVRILFEAQASEPDFFANYFAALNVNERLGALRGVDLSRFECVRDLFSPSHRAAGFSLWHAVGLSPQKVPQFKVYLNPLINGAEAAYQSVAEAMQRLGFGKGTREFLNEMLTCGKGQAELKYFSLDLSDDTFARTKVYICHDHATARQVEALFSRTPLHREGDVEAFCRAMVGHEGPFSQKPVCTCYAFTSGSDEPRTATLHLPVAHYVGSDGATVDAVSAFLAEQGTDPLSYARSVAALARQPLAESKHVQSYASYRRERGGLRFTAYLSPELFRNGESKVRLDVDRDVHAA